MIGTRMSVRGGVITFLTGCAVVNLLPVIGFFVLFYFVSKLLWDYIDWYLNRWQRLLLVGGTAIACGIGDLPMAYFWGWPGTILYGVLGASVFLLAMLYGKILRKPAKPEKIPWSSDCGCPLWEQLRQEREREGSHTRTEEETA